MGSTIFQDLVFVGWPCRHDVIKQLPMKFVRLRLFGQHSAVEVKKPAGYKTNTQLFLHVISTLSWIVISDFYEDDGPIKTL